MAWGCFSAHSVGRIHRIVGIMDAVMFNRILQFVVKPSCEELDPDDDYMFQQDFNRILQDVVKPSCEELDPKHAANIN
jgi:hypothetical protein